MANCFRYFIRQKLEIQNLEFKKIVSYKNIKFYSTEQAKDVENLDDAENEFRVLQIKPSTKKEEKKQEQIINLPPPRSSRMPIDQDWTNVWPAQRTFHPAVVPFPVRQGVNKHGLPPDKYANSELMKIPNFLHLTPPAIQKHCEALKQFCTAWPEELQTDEDMEEHFPIEVVVSDYCHSSPTIRDPMARIVSLKIKLKNLYLDEHAKDKFLRLVGKRYDPKTDYVTITTDSCPLKKQNYDYAQYLLTALLYESWKYEDWEKEKSDEDFESYIFSKRQSYRNIKSTFEYNNQEMPDTTEFAEAVENWHNKGDSPEVIEKYKQASLKLLSLPAL